MQRTHAFESLEFMQYAFGILNIKGFTFHASSTMITLANKKKSEEQLPVLFLNTQLYAFLVSVYPGTKKLLQKIVFKFENHHIEHF